MKALLINENRSQLIYTANNILNSVQINAAVIAPMKYLPRPIRCIKLLINVNLICEQLTIYIVRFMYLNECRLDF